MMRIKYLTKALFFFLTTINFVAAFNISTASESGNYYKTIKTLKEKYKDELSDIVISTSKGSVDNIERLKNKLVDAAIVQSDVVADERDRTPIKSVANLYTEYAHILVNKFSGINRISDLENKKVAVGLNGSGSDEFARKTFGKKLSGIEFINEENNIAVEKLKKGEIDAMIIVSSVPEGLVRKNIKDQRIKLLQPRKDEVGSLIEDVNGVSVAKIPARVYGFHGKINTFGVGAHLMVKADADPDLVYNLTKKIWKDKEFGYQNKSGKLDPRLTIFAGLKTSLHEGSLRFYKEVVAAY